MITAVLDMEMPMSCDECRFHDVTIRGWDEYCELVGKSIYSAMTRPKGCPLEERD